MTDLPDVYENTAAIFDAADASQIKNSDALRQELIYKAQGETRISYAGIKYLVFKMSQLGQSLAPAGDIKISLSKYDDTDKSQWFWEAESRMRNQHTGFETVGVASQPYLETLKNGKSMFDAYGRTKAVSKAKRNAQREQIPEVHIQNLLDTATGNQVKNLTKPYVGTRVSSDAAANDDDGGSDESTMDAPDWCRCSRPAPSTPHKAGLFQGIPICGTCNKTVKTKGAMDIWAQKELAQ